MIVEKLEVGPIMANCFIAGCEETQKCAIIDPGDEAERILAAVKKHGFDVAVIINTHGHFDHVGGNADVKAATGATLLIHELDAPWLSLVEDSAARWGLSGKNSPPPDRFLVHEDTISVGNLTFTAIHTPGHSPGGVSLLCGNDLFVGDTLFSGSIGRTDLPKGDHKTLLTSIRERLYVLPDEVVVYTGHGPETTIGRERRSNPFVQG